MKQTVDKQSDNQALYFNVAPGVWGAKDVFVNMYFVQNEEDNSWILVDAGLKSSASKIKKIAEKLFGADSKPRYILLTHGHFDHIGALNQLCHEWRVPVYAHYLELPYLTGIADYPPADPSVGGGLMASMSWLYPKKSAHVGAVQALGEDHQLPDMPEWKWVHTPGHAPGHISIYREKDKVMIAGDAIVTTKSESVLSIMKQEEVLSGPPKYFTFDWSAAEQSVNKLATINPNVVATGHGMPMSGEDMQKQLYDLSQNFKKFAVPTEGRYVADPAIFDANGVFYIPPMQPKRKKQLTIGAAVAVGVIVAGTVAAVLLTKKKKQLSKSEKLLNSINKNIKFIKSLV